MRRLADGAIGEESVSALSLIGTGDGEAGLFGASDSFKEDGDCGEWATEGTVLYDSSSAVGVEYLDEDEIDHRLLLVVASVSKSASAKCVCMVLTVRNGIFSVAFSTFTAPNLFAKARLLNYRARA